MFLQFPVPSRLPLWYLTIYIWILHWPRKSKASENGCNLIKISEIYQIMNFSSKLKSRSQILATTPAKKKIGSGRLWLCNSSATMVTAIGVRVKKIHNSIQNLPIHLIFQPLVHYRYSWCLFLPLRSAAPAISDCWWSRRSRPAGGSARRDAQSPLSWIPNTNGLKITTVNLTAVKTKYTV